MSETKRLSTLFQLYLVIIILVAGGFAMAQEESEYLSVTGPCNLKFPADNGPHAGYRTEWWYYTGNLISAKGNRFGFQITLFRTQISPPGFEKKWPQPSSPWRARQIYIGHAAITDISGKQHLQAQRIARAALGLSAGAQNGAVTDISIHDWSLHIAPDSHILKVSADDFAYEFYLIPEKPPVLHGDTGYIRKGSRLEQASCYSSFTRLKTTGTISINGETISVEGFSWMDHEFGTAPLDPEVVGWDWFSLQLSDNTEVMLYLLREEDGTTHPVSSGSWVNASGEPHYLEIDDFKVDVLKTWESPQSNAVYPARWQVQILPLALELTIFPNLPDQEMRTLQSTGVIYWEGSVSLAGMKKAKSITGQGYVELTGYARSLDAPM